MRQRRAERVRSIRARKYHEHRDQRAEMQRDVEREAGIRPVKQPWREGEVRRDCDRQELREALDEPEDERLDRRSRRMRSEGRKRAVVARADGRRLASVYS